MWSFWFYCQAATAATATGWSDIREEDALLKATYYQMRLEFLIKITKEKQKLNFIIERILPQFLLHPMSLRSVDAI